MDALDRERLSDRDSMALFARLFPHGLAGEDVLTELAPDGWERSPMSAVFHPSVDQVYRESVRLHRNIERLVGARRKTPPRPEPSLDDIRREWRPAPIEVDREVRELVGRCLWDVFSDNHEVVAPDGRLVDIGSFRGAGDFIADLLNRETGSRQYDYMDFYMGTIWVNDRADLTPVYAMIFRRLARHGCDWEYVFPRLHVVHFDRDHETTDLADRLERERQRAELEQTLEDGHRDALDAAKDRPPPPPVEAYRQAYGDFPRGWPPWD